MNPWASFMALSPMVKMTAIICFTVVVMGLMYFAVDTGTFGDLLAYVFGGDSAKK